MQNNGKGKTKKRAARAIFFLLIRGKSVLHVQFVILLITVLNFQKKILRPAGPQVFIFGRQNKYSSRQNLHLKINGIQ